MENLWNIEDLDLLASDLDTNLTGLGGATSSTFDMSDALSAIQVIKMNKDREDLTGDHSGDKSEQSPFYESLSKYLNGEKTKSQQDLSSWNVPALDDERNKGRSKIVKKPCRTPSSKQPDEVVGNSRMNEVIIQCFNAVDVDTFSSIVSAPTLCRTLSQCSLQPGFSMREHLPAEGEFQYVLAAATAYGTKIGEETLTYLNQGQPYEIRLKKLRGLSEMRGKLLKSVLRVGFQERRLQFREKSEIFAWQSQRPSERILDIDLSLSYGIFDVIPDSRNINCCEFMWDPTREASVFLKINCISTEFTCKRRGGEKGVPFRILIETYSHWEDPPCKLDSASCLVKVFKSKGADRKHKTDKEKLEKLPQAEQRDLQPSYQCTVFTPSTVKVENIPFQDFRENMSPSSLNDSIDIKTESPVISTTEVTTSTPSSSCSPQHIPETREKLDVEDLSATQCPEYITANSSVAEVRTWLAKKKFSKYLSCFALFSGKDLLCLNREDIIEICGVVDGIRLYNSLHVRYPTPLRKFYVSKDKLTYHGVYLYSLTCTELKEEICRIYGLTFETIGSLYTTGPDGILVVVCSKVVQNMKNESVYICELLKGEDNQMYTVILKGMNKEP